MNSQPTKKINPLNHPICYARPLTLRIVSAWIEHVPFGMYIVDVLRPKVLVELGTNKGGSYSAFCQAVKQAGLDTRCFAVDTWEGDLHTGAYGANVLAELRARHDPLYSDFSSLIQSTFDDAVAQFANGSIDLLHIDGLHTYEAAKHDFETWLPKLSKHAVVLFHDTNERERDFGVWKLWAELQPAYPHFEFLHGHGLGVLQLESEPASELELLFSLDDEQSERVRDFFHFLGSRLSAAAEGEHLLAQKERAIRSLTAQLREKETLITQMEHPATRSAITPSVDDRNMPPPAEGIKRKLRRWLLPANSRREKMAYSVYKALKGSTSR